MRQPDIKGLSPPQIADKFALPTVPTSITTIKPPVGTRIRVGEVNENFRRPGGGTQFQLLDKVNSGWTDVKPLRGDDVPKGTIQHTRHSLNQKINREVKSIDALNALKKPTQDN